MFSSWLICLLLVGSLGQNSFNSTGHWVAHKAQLEIHWQAHDAGLRLPNTNGFGDFPPFGILVSTKGCVDIGSQCWPTSMPPVIVGYAFVGSGLALSTETIRNLAMSEYSYGSGATESPQYGSGECLADYATVNNSYFLLYDQSEVCKGVAVLPNDETGRAQRRIDYYATNDCNGSVLSNDFLSPFYENEAFYSSSQECASLGDTVPVSVRGIGWINGSDVQLSPTAIYLDASTFTSVYYNSSGIILQWESSCITDTLVTALSSSATMYQLFTNYSETFEPESLVCYVVVMAANSDPLVYVGTSPQAIPTGTTTCTTSNTSPGPVPDFVLRYWLPAGAGPPSTPADLNVIIGGVVAGAVFVVLVTALACWLWRRNKERQLMYEYLTIPGDGGVQLGVRSTESS